MDNDLVTGRRLEGPVDQHVITFLVCPAASCRSADGDKLTQLLKALDGVYIINSNKINSLEAGYCVAMQEYLLGPLARFAIDAALELPSLRLG